MSPTTPHPISTTGTSPAVTTTKTSGETSAEWVDRHDTAVQGTTPSGNTLTTTYTSTQGAELVETIRLPNETDGKFLARHQNDYMESMANHPPVP
ncbi:MAG TPA: hypothetical protein VK843_13850 [Planctomycetota bacterium]|nr:hypothetical protein [Planctomycetota bacterium]